MTSVTQSKENRALADDRGAQLRRKRLGQYFTGPRLARLLAALSEAEQVGQVIDPMAGTGDMLQAVHAISPQSELFGVEIDPQVAARCLNALSVADAKHTQVITGDAFDWQTLSRLPPRPFDLVITNPPYVRYQSFSDKNAQYLD